MLIREFNVSDNLILSVNLNAYKYLYAVLKNSRQFLSYSQRTDFQHQYVTDALKYYFMIHLIVTRFPEQASRTNISKKFFSEFLSDSRCKTIKHTLSDEKGLLEYKQKTIKENDKWNTITTYSITTNLTNRKLEEIASTTDEYCDIEIALSPEALEFFTKQ